MHENTIRLGSSTGRVVMHVIVAAFLVFAGSGLMISAVATIAVVDSGEAIVGAVVVAIVGGVGCWCWWIAWVYVRDTLARGARIEIGTDALTVFDPHALARPLRIPLVDILAVAVPTEHWLMPELPVFDSISPAPIEEPIGYLTSGSTAAFPTFTSGAIRPNLAILMRRPHQIQVLTRRGILGRRARLTYTAAGLLLTAKSRPRAREMIEAHGLVGYYNSHTLDLAPAGVLNGPGQVLMSAMDFALMCGSEMNDPGTGFQILGVAGAH
ncbi:MAG: hypothetical protein WAP35_00480 [Solirubrobacterales bacterium]